MKRSAAGAVQAFKAISRRLRRGGWWLMTIKDSELRCAVFIVDATSQDERALFVHDGCHIVHIA